MRIVRDDLFRQDVSPADVVLMYLMPNINERLIPVLRNGTWRGSFLAEVHDNFGIDMREAQADAAYPVLLGPLLSPQGAAEDSESGTGGPPD